MADELDISYKFRHCRKFVVNLLKEKDVFEFVKNPDVDGANNAAERAIRLAVIARKIGGGSRSPKGAETYEILFSVLQILHMNGQDLLACGSEILLTSHG